MRAIHRLPKWLRRLIEKHAKNDDVSKEILRRMEEDAWTALGVLP